MTNRPGNTVAAAPLRNLFPPLHDFGNLGFFRHRLLVAPIAIYLYTPSWENGGMERLGREEKKKASNMTLSLPWILELYDHRTKR